MQMIRIMLPFHLRTLARIDGEVKVEVDGTARLSLGSVLDVLKAG